MTVINYKINNFYINFLNFLFFKLTQFLFKRMLCGHYYINMCMMVTKYKINNVYISFLHF